MDTIRVDVGVYTLLEVDLSNFDFSGVEKVVMTMKNVLAGTVIKQEEFTEAQACTVEVTPEESRLFRGDAEYDFMIVTDDGKCLKNGDNGLIILRKGCGECSESPSAT